MNQKMTWEEIKNEYPDQWVSLTDVEKDEKGEVQTAIVVASGPDTKTLTKRLKGKDFIGDRLEYTGRIKRFLGFAKWDIEKIGHASPTG